MMFEYFPFTRAIRRAKFQGSMATESTLYFFIPQKYKVLPVDLRTKEDLMSFHNQD